MDITFLVVVFSSKVDIRTPGFPTPCAYTKKGMQNIKSKLLLKDCWQHCNMNCSVSLFHKLDSTVASPNTRFSFIYGNNYWVFTILFRIVTYESDEIHQGFEFILLPAGWSPMSLGQFLNTWLPTASQTTWDYCLFSPYWWICALTIDWTQMPCGKLEPGLESWASCIEQWPLPLSCQLLVLRNRALSSMNQTQTNALRTQDLQSFFFSP